MTLLRRIRQDRRARIALRWGFGVALVALLLVGLDPELIGRRVAEADLRLVAVALVGLAAIHLVGGLTWWLLCLRLAGVRLPLAPTARRYYTAQAIGGVTPANLGGDAYRVLVLTQEGLSARHAAGPVVVQRATSYLALSLLALLAVPALLVLTPVARGPVVAVALGALAAAALVVLLFIGGGRISALRQRVMAVDATPAALGAAGAIGLGLGLVFHAGSVLLTLLLVLAVDPAAPPLATFSAIALARLTLAIPISPSGLGVQEGALSVLFAGMGLAPGVALAALLLGRVALVATGLIGAAMLLVGPRPGRNPQGGGVRRLPVLSAPDAPPRR